MRPTPMNFVARFKAKPGCAGRLQAAMERCVAPTRAEPGCVNYDLHKSADEEGVFVIYEGWRGQDALARHFETPHLKALLAEAEDLVAEHGPDGKPFTAQTLTMLTEPEPLKS